MSRWWNELAAAVTDVVPPPLLALLLFLAAAVVAALWYWFPAWVPRRLPRFGRLHWHRPRWHWRWPTLRWRWSALRARWRRRRDAEPAAPEPVDDAGLPDLTAEAFLSLADRLAAEGRYAEAVRERLRAMVRELVDREVIEHRPGWTVTELAAAAGARRPVVDAPLGEASDVFSRIWYGQRPAHAEHDDRMRALGADLHAALGAAP